MNEDELVVAREAVAATRAWREQMRADWGVGFREPEEVLDQAVGELEAERDRLRAVVENIVVEWERIGGDAEVVEIYTLLAEMHRLVAGAHAALDVSEVMGGPMGEDSNAETMVGTSARLGDTADPGSGDGADGGVVGVPRRSDMTVEQAYEFYADPANREPVGPPVRRSAKWHCRCGERYAFDLSACPACGTERESVGARIKREGEEAREVLVNRLADCCPDCGNPDRYCDCPDREAYDFYADPANREPVGPPVRRGVRATWDVINQLADEQTGVDGNVIRGWLDCTVRPVLLGDNDDST